VDNQVQVSPNNPNNENKEKKNKSTKKNDLSIVDNQAKSFVPKAPFPQCLQANRKKNHCKGILKVLKNVQINILFLDVSNQISSYAKFLKDLTIVKRKTLFLVKRHSLHKHSISFNKILHQSIRILGVLQFQLG